ncbi:hypothetical protein A2422_04525 [Candidatus Woesebacteria bacterium RIFOXYC1_FULL_31_51]|uniref:YoaR-like putative peptidoglycan binding domain-containing protein n=1 Tax=Candidatus Woesebacteria bacterium GW2011_GWC2_31_9 TaxID=1618586 RepID=A0A0F9YKF8_9BACT|nr:MAG: hypothetical protein UR17_C0001G0270 [Candidatus Woesebacteria bacterium GW2011_GWF1_31_35]KKP23234.1 MAG: hypothetical protein UR11_C0001G0208 [Candidatus Woesebacteria bacterium GW2011_GWC1_30_29]KKP25514.1 MAG: hypothetical protein UR13_C0008G0030 [Candidatus Woesebacteria bacterium GW2011_GWD1_31_12]KKP27496.1 MAG: hypothetical protein UR16_C0003G0156 [Candidatus Woesebacteria bacterium GW2011_GWB1_31_29]KKP31984.1 MAG: hypothetical protein UR21_C0003G0017 [Candidatus Woesebacteria 
MAKLKKQKRLKKIFLLVFVPLFFISLLIAIIFIPFNKRVFPNIFVAGQYVGDKSKSDAVSILEKNILVPDKINLYVKGTKYEILTSEISLELDYPKTVDRAYNYSNSGNLINDLITKIKLIIKPVNLSLTLKLDEDKLLESLLIISDKVGTKPIKSSVTIINNEVIADPGKNGVEVDIQKLRSDIGKVFSLSLDNNIQVDLKEVNSSLNTFELENYKSKAIKLIGKKIELKITNSNPGDTFENITLKDTTLVSFLDAKKDFDEEVIIEEIMKVSRTINRNPQDSVFIVENEKVSEFIPSKDGITVDEKKLLEEIKQKTIDLETGTETTVVIDIPIAKSEAKIKNEDVNNLGIKTLLGKGVSHFRGSITNRIYNVNLASSKFKGILVPPGETFSFNNVLGDVSAYTGYKAAYVIKDGRTVLGDGGGVCQVSTTLFRALLAAGLPIIERKPHSYRVGYYEQGFPPGLDATVYAPTADLKFLNDTPAYILIQSSIDNPSFTLTFEVYGTSDGRVATTSKPIIASSTAPAEDLYVDDPTLPLGIIKQIEHKAWGAKVIFDYKVVRNGETLIDQKFISNYRPWQAVYLRGTGVVN